MSNPLLLFHNQGKGKPIGGMAYWQSLKNIFGSSALFIFPFWEAPGATTAEDISGKNNTALILLNPSFGQPGIASKTALTLSGNGLVRLFPAVNTNFNPAAGFFSAWMKLTTAVWEDGTNDYLLQITAGIDALWIRKSTVAHRLQAAHITTGSSMSFDINSIALTDWFNYTVTWGPTGGLLGYINGQQLGSGGAIGIWTGGSPTVFIVGAATTGPGSPYNGVMQFACLGTKELTPTEVRSISSPFDDAIFLPDGATLLQNGYTTPMALGSIIYAAHGQYASKSTDFGDTWIDFPKNFGTNIMSVFPAINGNLFVGLATGVIWRSTDNGANWTLVNTTSGGYITPWGWTQAADGTLFSGEYTGPALAGQNHIFIWRSTNDGDTWTRINGLTGSSNEHVHIVMNDPETNRLYASIGDNPKNCLYSDDNGANWIGLFAITDKGFTGITSIPGTRFLGDDRVAPFNRILKTVDDITPIISYIPKWEYNDSYIEIVSVHGTNTLFATIWGENQRSTQKSAILRSDDAGITWQIIANSPSGMYKFHKICYDYRHRIPTELPYLIVECMDNTQMMRISI